MGTLCVEFPGPNQLTVHRVGAGVYVYVGFGVDTGLGFECKALGHTGYMLPVVQLPTHRKGENPYGSGESR